MHRRGKSIEESGVGVGRKVHHEGGRRSDRPRDLEVQLDLAVRSSGSPLGVFVAPSTETAVMAGGAIPWVRKYASNSVAVYPPPSSRNAIVTPVPSLPGGKAYALATWDGV